MGLRKHWTAFRAEALSQRANAHYRGPAARAGRAANHVLRFAARFVDEPAQAGGGPTPAAKVDPRVAERRDALLCLGLKGGRPSQQKIKKAYRAALQESHPDRFTEGTAEHRRASARTRAVIAAWETLRDR